MKYVYRRLKETDIPPLKELLAVFAQAFNQPDEYQGHVPRGSYFKALLQMGDFVVIVAQADGKVAGGLVAYVVEKFEQERKEVYIYDLAVAEEHRRRGIATALILKLKQVAKKLGAYVIFVQADKGDEPAIKLYQSLGKAEEVFNFDIEVD